MKHREHSKRCERCRYRRSSANGRLEAYGCDYLAITGQSRLAEAYRRLGMSKLTPEARELMRPDRCPFFREGKRKRSRPKVG